MKQELKIEKKEICWSLVTDITYCSVPAWYGATFRDLKCSICMPKIRTGEKYPLLIWICGGAFKVMNKDVWWPQWISFAKKGCVVASVEYRTSNEAVFPSALCDIKTAIRYFKVHAEQYGIDPQKIFVAGESAGGALASLAGVTGNKSNPEYDEGAWQDEDSSVCGVIDYYGVTDMRKQQAVSVWEHTEKISRGGDSSIAGNNNATANAESQFLGIEGDIQELQEKASAVCHVTVNTPPFLIFHGDCDDLVDISQSEKLYQALQESGVYADYYVLEGEGHGSDAFYQENVMGIVRDFVLKIAENPGELN